MARKSPAKPARPKPSSSRSSSGKSSFGKGSRWYRRARLAFIFQLLLLLGGGGWYLFQTEPRQAEVRQLVGNAFAQNKQVNLWDIAGDLYQLYYSPDFVSAPTRAGDRTHLYAGAPRVAGDGDAIPAGRFLRNTGYLLGYSDELGAPLWAAYRIADITPLPQPGARPTRFEIDTRTIARIDADAFTGSGYDRGHLAPNYGIATRFGENAQRETFLMSNIVAQRPGLNAGLWKRLEMNIATSYPARFGEIWVMAGPVFSQHAPRLPERSIGAQPSVPEAFFMILVDESDGRMRSLAFLFPQEPSEGASLEDFLTTVDDIELRSGLDFFGELPHDAEAELESRRAAQVW
ncbi:MAG: DNA/RNA non-specific endonuclease [Verrucomicrobia bacterium]|nr:MAG: DNA/RNA non-specific endonuclease [Verrucomicrobiota bacterium]